MTSQSWEYQYLNIVKELVELNDVTPDRTGTGRIRVFGRDIRVNLSDGTLPVVTTRKIRIEHGINELLWMIKGSSNIKDLADDTKVIWKDWAIKEEDVDKFIAKFCESLPEASVEFVKKQMLEKHLGSIGPMYGKFWRNNPVSDETSFLPFDSLLFEDIPSDKRKLYGELFDEYLFFAKQAALAEGKELTEDQIPDKEMWIKKEYFESCDQLGEAIRGIKRRPYSARHIISAWIPNSIPYEGVYSPQENVLIGKGALTACHGLPVQFFVEKALDGGPDFLSLRMYQRSCDMILGVATNLHFYAVLLHMVAHCTDLRVKEFIWTSGDTHLYRNHLEGAIEQLTREPYPSPTIRFNPDQKDIFAMTRDDIFVENYQHHPFIKFAVSV